MVPPATDSDGDRLHVEALPVVDLRLLSQSELYALSLSSSSADLRSWDHVVSPKIDRSVFNESAGSRRQTYSRIRLAPPKPHFPSSTSSSRSRRAEVYRSSSPDPVDHENSRIISCLRDLFPPGNCHNVDLVPVEIQFGGSMPETVDVRDSVDQIPIDIVDSTAKKRKRGPKPKTETPGNENKGMVAFNDNAGARDVRIEKIGAGDALENTEDPYGLELRRRTEGLATEADIRGFLENLNGEWGSKLKKRKIVDASEFGHVLPTGWKLMLLLKRRESLTSVTCSRFISPNGQRFKSFKEVSSYLISSLGPQDARQPCSGSADEHLLLNMTSGNVANLTSKDDQKREGHEFGSSCVSFPTDHYSQLVTLETVVPGEFIAGDILKRHECIMTSGDKDSLLNHQSLSHSGDVKTVKPDGVDGNIRIAEDANVEVSFGFKDSVAQTSDAKADDDPTSVIPHGELNSRDVTGACSGKFICQDEEKLKDYKSDSTLLGNIHNKQDRDQTASDNGQENLCDPMNADVTDTNLCSSKDDWKCTDKDNCISDGHVSERSANDLGASDVAVEKAKPEISFGSGSRTHHTDYTEVVKDNCVISRQTKELGTDCESSGTDEQVKQITRERFLVAQDDKRFSVGDDLERDFASISATSNLENCSEYSLSTLTGHEQLPAVHDDVSVVSTCELDVQKSDMLLDPKHSTLTNTFDRTRTQVDEDSISTSEHMVNSDNYSFVVAYHDEQSSASGNIKNAVPNCSIAFPQRKKVSESSIFSSRDNGENSAVKVSVTTVGEAGHDVSQKSIFDFDSIGNRHDASIAANGFPSVNEEKTSIEHFAHGVSYSRMASVCSSVDHEPLKDSENNLDQASTRLVGNPELHNTVTCWSSGLTNAFGSKQTGENVENVTKVMQKKTPEGCSPVLSGVQPDFARKYNILDTVDLEQKGDGGGGLLSLSYNNSQTFYVKDDVEKSYADASWEGWRLGKEDSSPIIQPAISVGCGFSQPDMWQSTEENDQAYDRYPLVHPSSQFSTFNVVPDKGENELNGLRSASTERLEFDFLAAQTNSFSHGSKLLSSGAEVGKMFDIPMWLGAEASPKIACRNPVTAICPWCRNEFSSEAVNSGMQTGSIGSMCPTCKAKF